MTEQFKKVEVTKDLNLSPRLGLYCMRGYESKTCHDFFFAIGDDVALESMTNALTNVLKSPQLPPQMFGSICDTCFVRVGYVDFDDDGKPNLVNDYQALSAYDPLKWQAMIPDYSERLDSLNVKKEVQ